MLTSRYAAVWWFALWSVISLPRAAVAAPPGPGVIVERVDPRMLQAVEVHRRHATRKRATPAMALALTACGDEPGQQPGNGTGPGPVSRWTLNVEPHSGPAVFLALESVSGDRAVLAVKVRGVPRLQGLAFRLRHDPTQVQVIRALPGGAWSAGGVRSVARFSPKTGELWAGVGHVGARGLAAQKEVTVARVELKLPLGGKVPLTFARHRGLGLDPEGRTLKLQWPGAALVKLRPW